MPSPPSPELLKRQDSTETGNSNLSSRATITFDEIRSITKETVRRKSRSNHHIKTPEFIDESEEECINHELGLDFYIKNPWVDRKSIQFAQSQYRDMIGSMGQLALQIIDRYAPWFAFILPAVIDDRKGWSVTKNGIIYVSTSVAYRPGTYFLNNKTVLELCLICDKVITHKFAVVCNAIIWKENFTGADLIRWTSNQHRRKACYCHWRDPSSVLIQGRNPYKIKNKKRTSSSSFVAPTSRSPPQLGASVLPINFI